jgi:pseudo-rSAM protein
MKQTLILYPDTFLWRKGDEGLLYNAQSGDMFRFYVTDSMGALCEQFENFDNLYSVFIDPDAFDEPIRLFIGSITDQGFGCIADADSMCISLPPLLNLQHDIGRLDKNKDHEISENVLGYLSTLTIYIGGKCRERPYFKQIIYPICSDKSLSAEVIARFLDGAWTPALHTINVVVSDASDPEIVRMGQSLAAYKDQIVFHFLYDDVKDEMAIPCKLKNAGYRVRFVCEGSGDLPPDKTTLSIFEYDFIVKNDREFQFRGEQVDKLGITKYTMIPVYNNNAEFFAKNVFMDEADIADTHLSRREIFAHQALNTNAFGKLTILPSGSVYSDVSAPALGKLNDLIYDLITRELENNYAWRKVRNSTTCCECVYQWLCPSPFSYEQVAGKETGCNFK